MLQNNDYIQELDKYLSQLSINDYQSFIELCLRAPADMRLMISEIGRLRSDIERYREDIAALRKEVFDKEKLISEYRPKANKYDRMVERLQPVDGGQYVNDVVEAFWKYLKDMTASEPEMQLDRVKIEKKLEPSISKKRNTPDIGLHRVDVNGDEITKASK